MDTPDSQSDGRRSAATLVRVAFNLPGSDIFKVSTLVGIDIDRLIALSNRRADASEAEVRALRGYVEETVRMAHRPLVIRKTRP